jgi:cysteine synthase
MFAHVADAVKSPALVQIGSNIMVARFETLKVYSALGAVRYLLDTGAVSPDDTLVDSSSGVYAYALALACHRYGLKCHIVGSPAIDQTLRVQLEILGVTLDQLDPSPNLKFDQGRRVAHIKQLLQRNPKMHWMRQYHDGIHYLGYREFAELVLRELDASRLTVVGGVGTGASTGALATYLREAGHRTRLCGVEPFGSVTFGGNAFEDPAAVIAGIGASLPFENVRHELYDTIHWISFDYSMSACVHLLREHALFAGLSTGASYLAARWEAGRDPDSRYLFIAADTGHRYVDKVFAQHRTALPLEDLRPAPIAAPEALRFPWSVMEWQRQPKPVEWQTRARHGDLVPEPA